MTALGRGAEPGGDAHGEHAESRGLTAVGGKEPGGQDCEGEMEGNEGDAKKSGVMLAGKS